MHNDDDFLGSEDDILGEEALQGGDELDFAQQVKNMNPRADQLQHFATLRKVKHQMLDSQAPFIRNNPPSILKGALGNITDIGLGAGGALVPQGSTSSLAVYRMPLVQVANWSGDDAETLPITVTFAQNTTQLLGTPTAPVRPFGIIQFGTRAISVTAEIDIGSGVQFTVNASAITLQVGIETRSDLVFPSGVTFFAQTKLAGMISFHPTTHALPVTRTRYIDEIVAGATTATVSVPLFARSLIFMHGFTATAAYLLTFYDSLAFPVYSYPILANSYPLDPIPLSTDVVAVKVARTDGGAAGNERLIFGLAF